MSDRYKAFRGMTTDTNIRKNKETNSRSNGTVKKTDKWTFKGTHEINASICNLQLAAMIPLREICAPEESDKDGGET